MTRPSDDPEEPWKGVAHLATTAKEITEAAGSYYNQTMALAELDLSRYDLPAKPRIAVVGTPCEIQGIRAMQSRRWPTGAHRIDSVVLTIALLCTKSFDYKGLMLQLLREDRWHRHRAGEQGRRHPGPDDRGVPRRRDRRGRAGQELPRRRPQGVRRVRRLPRPQRRPLGGQRRGHGRVEQRAGALRAGRGAPSTTPGVASTSASWTTPGHWSSWTPSTSGSPSTACAASSTPTHRCSSTTPSTSPPTRGTDRAPVVADR